MTELSLADWYAEISLSRSPDIITARSAPVGRIIDNITHGEIFAMVSAYFGLLTPDMTWFRDQLVVDDTGFSLVNNAREVRLLSAAILDQLVQQGNNVAVLALATASLGGKRLPEEFASLIGKALDALEAKAVRDRQPRDVETRITPTPAGKLDDINALVDGDWSSWRAMLGKVRTDAAGAGRSVATQTQAALTEIYRQVRLQREENQLLWWLIGGYSRAVARPFAQLSLAESAVLAAVDMGNLTSVSHLGPAAAPALLERVISQAKRSKGAGTFSLAAAIDELDRADLKSCKIYPDVLPDQIALITTAIELARTLGRGTWHGRFTELTGAPADIEFEPLELATLLYREHLLGQLL